MASRLLGVRLVAETLITVVTLLLAGMIAASSLSTRHFLHGDYKRAARLNPASADTAVEVAGEALDDGNLPEADRFSRTAIRNLPLNSNAIAILALTRRQSGEMAQADRLMSAAARMGWENIDVQVWALDKALRSNDAIEMILRADALLEQEFDSPPTFSIMRYASTKPEGFNCLAARLAARPKWRRTYLVGLAGISPPDYAIHRKLLAALERSSAPPSAEERDAFDRAVAALPRHAPASVVR